MDNIFWLYWVFHSLFWFYELGHFLMAKLSGMHVEEFFIGFGPKLLKFKSRSGTLWGISAIPVGGYNKILGMERDSRVPPEMEHKSYSNKPNYKKFLVIAGGVSLNGVVAVLLIMLFLSMGVYQATTVIDYMDPQAPASESGLQPGDKVIAIDGNKIESWEEFSPATRQHQGAQAEYTILRDGEELNIGVELEQTEEGFLSGDRATSCKAESFFGQVVKQSMVIPDIIVTYVKLFGMLFQGQLSFSEARPVSPVGVISIFQQSAAMGAQNFILFIALVSLIVGFGKPDTHFAPGRRAYSGTNNRKHKKKPLPKRLLEVLNTLGIIF
ncbi:MAG: M50 family metallopeptidase [Actinomycetota bacterium]|nr:M50 family metallopeptidase [Actinomycetota bacterium]